MKPIWVIEWNGSTLVSEATGRPVEYKSAQQAHEAIKAWFGGGTMRVIILRMIDYGSES